MVVWTPRARDDLKAIHDYIAQDAPINAKNVTRDILSKAATLVDLPPLQFHHATKPIFTCLYAQLLQK
jgi:toxin ParE1/3/4